MSIKLNRFTLIVIFLTSVFTACNNNDDDNSQVNIVGRWQVEKREHICPDQSDNTIYPDNTTWDFKPDGTYAIYGSSTTTPIFEATYERANGNIIYLCYAGDCSSSYSVTLSGEKLILEETEAIDSDCVLRYTFVKP